MKRRKAVVVETGLSGRIESIMRIRMPELLDWPGLR